MAQNITKAGNTLDKKIVDQFIADWERAEAEIRTIKAENAKRCRDVQERRDGILKVVKGAGMTAKAFKATVKIRAKEREIEAIEAELEDDDADSFEQIQAALGVLADTPLGQAASAGKGKAKPEDGAVH
jgi:uncharacterized protein (UPF0335 family)